MKYEWIDGVKCGIIDGSTSEVNNKSLEENQGAVFRSGGKGNGNTLNGGRLYLEGGYVSNSAVNYGYVKTSGGTLDGIQMVGGEANINAGTTLQGDITVNGSARATVGANGYVYTSGNVRIYAKSGSVTINQIGAASLYLYVGASVYVTKAALKSLTVTSYSTNYSFDITDLDPTTIIGVSRSTGKLVIHTTNGDVTINGNLQGYQFKPDGKGGTIVSSCFAEGTLIQTPDGEKPVETLKLGDLVSTHRGPQPIRWLGKKHVDLRGATDRDNFLVRIKANAFEAGKPRRDLWVTPEHAVLVGERLIPVRMLVNGASIAYDLKRRQYTYYHFAFEKHAVVFSEALPSESYMIGRNERDFGTFETSGEAIDNAPAFPFVTEITEARKIWQALADRSNAIGIPVAMSSSATPERRVVRIRTDLGTQATLKDVNERHAVFSIPAGTKYVVVESDAWRPDQIHGPYWDDRRHLGVRVGAVRVSDQQRSVVIDDHLNETCLGGWNNIEDGCSRWTNGKGIIPLARAPRSFSKKELELAITFPDREDIAF